MHKTAKQRNWRQQLHEIIFGAETKAGKTFDVLFTILILVIVFGALIYLIEGEENGFTSIPRSIYWAIVTMTTVGYGDISPKTNLGQALAAMVMIVGYSIIAVPTGIVTAEITHQYKKNISNRPCPGCGESDHDDTANYCQHCGTKI